MIRLRGLAAVLRDRVRLSGGAPPEPKTYASPRRGLEAAVRERATATYSYRPLDPVYPAGPRKVTVGAVFRLRSTGRLYAHVWSAGRGWRTHRVDRCGPVTVVPATGPGGKVAIPPGFRRSYYSRVGTLLASIR